LFLHLVFFSVSPFFKISYTKIFKSFLNKDVSVNFF
ncbi:hypothetical protein LINGRAPRIM_LOCUS636, partial [Linum grandiflorum]